MRWRRISIFCLAWVFLFLTEWIMISPKAYLRILVFITQPHWSFYRIQAQHLAFYLVFCVLISTCRSIPCVRKNSTIGCQLLNFLLSNRTWESICIFSWNNKFLLLILDKNYTHKICLLIFAWQILNCDDIKAQKTIGETVADAWPQMKAILRKSAFVRHNLVDTNTSWVCCGRIVRMKTISALPQNQNGYDELMEYKIHPAEDRAKKLFLLYCPLCSNDIINKNDKVVFANKRLTLLTWARKDLY